LMANKQPTIEKKVVESCYEMLKINVEDTYKNIDRTFKKRYARFKRIAKKTNQLEEEINQVIADFEFEWGSAGYKFSSTKDLSFVNTMTTTPQDNVFISTCETERKLSLKRATSISTKIPKRFLSSRIDNREIYEKYYNTAVKRKAQLLEVNLSISHYYTKEVKPLIKNSKRNNHLATEANIKQNLNEYERYATMSNKREKYEYQQTLPSQDRLVTTTGREFKAKNKYVKEKIYQQTTQNQERLTTIAARKFKAEDKYKNERIYLQTLNANERLTTTPGKKIDAEIISQNELRLRQGQERRMTAPGKKDEKEQKEEGKCQIF